MKQKAINLLISVGILWCAVAAHSLVAMVAVSGAVLLNILLPDDK